MTRTFLDDLHDDLVRASRELSTREPAPAARPSVTARRSRVRRLRRVGRLAPLVALFVIGGLILRRNDDQATARPTASRQPATSADTSRSGS